MKAPHLLYPRRILGRWAGWFFFINVVVATLVCLACYQTVMPNLSVDASASTTTPIIGWLFFCSALVAQSSLFLFISCAVVCLVMLFYPRRWLIVSLAIVFATAVVFGLIADFGAFRLYHMHYLSVGVSVFKAHAFTEEFALSSQEILLLSSVAGAVLSCEALIALCVWRKIKLGQARGIGYWCAGLLALISSITYGLITVVHFYPQWLDEATEHVIMTAARVAPYLSDSYMLVTGVDQANTVYYANKSRISLQNRAPQRLLHYPLASLQCHPPLHHKNVVLIVVDTWRYHAMNQQVTPHIANFARDNIQFINHYSGGNCTQPGIFSLFYGLPATYWSSFLSAKKGPVLMHELQQQGYQLGIFASASLDFPQFDKTVFVAVPHYRVRTPGDNSIVRDEAITHYFQNFIRHRHPNQPFFSFLFYDAVHNYCEHAVPDNRPFAPVVQTCDRFMLTRNSPRLPYLNRYYNAAHFVDDEVGKVLATLKHQHLLKNTVVIITADHGEQLNDERLGYWVHASAYTTYQLHVPMIIHWPGHKPGIISYFTTHHDVVPTVISDILGCESPIADYSVGRSLFLAGHRPYLIAGSYGDYAIIAPTQVTRIYPSGDYAIDNLHGHAVHRAEINFHRLALVKQDLSRYYQHY